MTKKKISATGNAASSAAAALKKLSQPLPPGATRTVVKRNYALITPNGFVPSVVPGWKNAVVIINISPVMNGPRFAQLQLTLDENSSGVTGESCFKRFQASASCSSPESLKMKNSFISLNG